MTLPPLSDDFLLNADFEALLEWLRHADEQGTPLRDVMLSLRLKRTHAGERAQRRDEAETRHRAYELPRQRIVRNAARCRRCGTEIESKHRHDYVGCACGAIAVDGGREYCKRTGQLQDLIELSEFEAE